MDIKEVAENLRQLACKIEAPEKEEPAPMFNVGEWVCATDEMVIYKFGLYDENGDPCDKNGNRSNPDATRKVLHLQVEGEDRGFQPGDLVMVKPMNREWEPAIYLYQWGGHRTWRMNPDVEGYFSEAIRFPNPGEWVSK